MHINVKHCLKRFFVKKSVFVKHHALQSTSMVLDNNQRSMVSIARELGKLCLPLQVFKITFFSYVKNFGKGGQVYLSNKPDWIEAYYTQKLHLSSQFEWSPELYKSGNYIWTGNKKGAVFDVAHKDFESFYGITIIKRGTDFTEFFFFSGSPTHSFLPSFYSDNIQMLEDFICYFKEKAKSKIAKAEKNKVFIPRVEFKSDAADDCLLPQIVTQSLSNLRQDFYSEIKADHPSMKKFSNIALTRREQECAYYLLAGMSAKVTGAKLFISQRTVEEYIRSLKEKFQCKNKFELAHLLTEFVEIAPLLSGEQSSL